ncbi:MAG: CpsD/CapB family tyrosine-protein kinase [Gammaproteobacteria bacterium]
MSASQEDMNGDDKDLRAELAAYLHFDSEAVSKIFETMQATDLSFIDAAIRLGLATRADVEEALIRAHSKEGEATSLIETAIRRISSERRVVLHQGAPVAPGKSLGIVHEPDGDRSERLRALRTELLLLNEGTHGANVVAVLSPSAGEGRSQLAAELAIAFAQLGRRTLLADTDLRNPQQHILFGTNNDHGLSNSLTSFETPAYHPVISLPQMHLLTAGPVPPNPLELLSNGRFEKLMVEWRNKYEFLVLDTPPVSQCADGVAIATLAGRVLVLSRAQHTSFKSMRDMLRRLATTQSKILGAVLNHF